MDSLTDSRCGTRTPEDGPGRENEGKLRKGQDEGNKGIV